MYRFTSGVDGAGSNVPRPGIFLQRAVAVLMALVVLVGGIAMVPSEASANAGAVTTTDDLNLRGEPALNSTILNVMPLGAGVEITGDPVNGFYPVAYQGQVGYAYSAYLSVGYTGDGPVTTGGIQEEVYVADGPVNFRTGPSTGDSVMMVIPHGALVALNGDSANGFLSIIYADTSGWAHAASILGTSDDTPVEVPAPAPAPETPSEPAPAPAPDAVPVGETVTGSATVIDGALNLRQGPSLDHAIITVMEDGAPVELRGEPQGGFFPVSYNGAPGWAYADFLQQGATEPEAPVEPETPAPAPPQPEEPAPAPTEPPAPQPTEPVTPPVDGSDGYTEEEIIQIIYAAADVYGQPREDMLRVARCESVLDPNAVNATSQASGLFQFLPSTWQRTPFADQDVFDPVANANATGWMWQQGNRNEWVCQ